MAIDINDPRARQMLLAGMPQQPMMQQPMAPQMAQPQAQGPDNLAQLTKLLGGDLSGSLTGGDKLLALAALMRSATRSGRRAGLTPQQVMGQLQQQKVAEVQNRLQIEQLRADKAQQEQQKAFIEQYAGALEDPQQRAALMALGPAEAAKKISEVAFRQRQVQQIVTDDKGETRLVFGDGTSGSLDFKLERGAKWIKGDPMGTGTQVLVKVDEKTETPIMEDGKFVTMAVGTSWADQKRIANDTERVRIARAAAARDGGDNGTAGKQTQLKTYKTPDGKVVSGEVRWDKSKDSWVDRAGTPITLVASPAKSDDPVDRLFAGVIGVPTF